MILGSAAKKKEEENQVLPLYQTIRKWITNDPKVDQI